jgi:A/G-specific adenine glycosylase
MKVSQKSFSQKLLRWYRVNARDLPWRQTKDPYKIWISEIMLQQTTVTAVIPYYEKWIKKFPTIECVARARQQTILSLWQGLGYYSRAKNIHKTAKIICQKFSGKIPEEPEIISRLPGFGPYTTGAVLSIAYDKPLAIIDANVRRVVMRQLAREGLADIKHDLDVREFLIKVIPKNGAGDFNQGLMELGALICRTREPRCNQCPVQLSCAAYAKGIQEIIPTPKKKIIKNIEAVIALIEHNGFYFIQKRNSKGLLADLWEFPGGKIEDGESVRRALKREIQEELNVQICSSKLFMKVVHHYTEFRVHLNVFTCQTDSLPRADTVHKWVQLNDLRRYPMPSGSARIVERLLTNQN